MVAVGNGGGGRGSSVVLNYSLEFVASNSGDKPGH